MRTHFLVLLIFTILTVLLTYPLILQMDTHLAGRDNDVWINPWANFWTKKAITEGLDYYHTDYQFFPQGVSLVFHSFSPLNAFLWWPLEPIFGDLAAYNLTILFAYALSGYGMWLLARYLTRNDFVAVLAGVVFAFAPYHMIESIHINIVSTQWLPFFALFLIKTIDEGKTKYAVIAALFLGLTALSGWHLLVFLFLWALLYVSYAALIQRAIWTRAKLQALTICAFLSLVFLLPLLYPIVQEQISNGVAYMAVRPEEGLGNHLAAFFIPTKFHPLLGDRLIQVNQLLGFSASRPAFVGYIVGLLALHAALSGKRETRFWAGATLIFVLLSLPARIPLRTEASLPVPWGAPVVALLRNPLRFNILISFCVAILAAHDLGALLQGAGKGDKIRIRHWRQMVIVAVVTAAVLFEYLTLPFPTTQVDVSPFFYQLAREEGEFAVVEFPIDRQANKKSLYSQTIHGKKTVAGMVARTPTGAYDYVEANPLLYAAWRGDPATLSSRDVVEGMARLDADDVRYVIFNKYLMVENDLSVWRDLLDIPPLYEDSFIAVHSTALPGSYPPRASLRPR